MTRTLRVSTLLLVAALVIVPIYGPRLFRLLPFTHDIDGSLGADDWVTYDRFARNVLDDGWTISAVPGNYSRPGGFGYVYFIALVYGILGARSGAVYLVQGLLLVASVVGVALLFRTRLSKAGALGLLVALALFMAADMLRYNTLRLLSENLLVPLIALLLSLVIAGISSGRAGWFVTAGVVCGMAALTRLNVVFFGPAIAALIAFHPWHSDSVVRRRLSLTFLAAFLAVSALLPFRNYVVTGGIGAGEALRPQGWATRNLTNEDGASTIARLGETARFYGARTAFAFGVPRFLEPDFQVRPHWLVMWTGVALYLAASFRSPLPFEDWLLLLLSAAYLLPLIAVAHISSYGYRMVTPVVVLALPIAVKGFERLAANRPLGIAPR